MEEYKRQLEHLAEIRSLMENASRFISLSGLSGVSAGLVALVGAWVTYLYLNVEGIFGNLNAKRIIEVQQQQLFVLVGIAVVIFLLAGTLASYFTMRRAKRLGVQVWNPTSRRVLIHMLVPLAAGGIFCILLAYHGYGRLVSSATLLFYGMALVNASKFTYKEIRYLGYTELVLGLIGAALLNYGIVLWALGFGVFHILYGIIMYLKYERNL